MSLESELLVLLLPLLPLLDALRPPVPERSCEPPSPELVLPDEPRSLVLESVLESLLVDELEPDCGLDDEPDEADLLEVSLVD